MIAFRLFRRARAGLADYLSGEPLFPILVLFLLNAVDEFDRATFELLGPEISSHFGVDIDRFGLITVFVILLVPLISVPVSYIADRWKRMPLAIMGAAAWGTFSLATGFAPSLLILFITRIGSDFGKVVNEPVHGALIGEFYSPRARVKAFGLHSLANPAGAAVAAVLAGFLAEWFGWRAPFFVLAVPTVIALVVASRLAEPERGRHEVVEVTTTPPLAATVRRLWAVRALRYQWIGLAFTSGAVIGIGVLVPFYLRDEFGVGPGRRGVLLGLGTALSVLGVLYGTTVAQRKLTEAPSKALRLLCWTGTIAAVALLAISVAPTLAAAMLFIWTVIVAIAFVTPGLRAITAIVAPPEIRSTAFALGGLIALAGAPFALIGFAIGDENMRWAVAVMAPIFFRGVLYFFKAANYLDDDVERLHPDHARKTRADGSGVLLEVKSLTVSYGGVKALFGVDMQVDRGEMVALLGTNGAGKSTTLNAISGIVEPDGGNVWFEGEPVTGEAPERTAARGIVQVPGGRGVFPGLTVEENLRMGCFMIRRDTSLVSERMGEVLALFPRLGERMAQKAGSLSGGERQMLTLAQSFVLRPKLLLIDELSLGLAPALVKELLQAVRAMNASGITIVLVEQSVNLALTLAHRAYFMEKGEVKFSGRTDELLKRRDLLRSVFLEGAGRR